MDCAVPRPANRAGIQAPCDSFRFCSWRHLVSPGCEIQGDGAVQGGHLSHCALGPLGRLHWQASGRPLHPISHYSDQVHLLTLIKAVIGNGCSAAQVVPAVAEKAAFVQQYARSAQWYHARVN